MFVLCVAVEAYPQALFLGGVLFVMAAYLKWGKKYQEIGAYLQSNEYKESLKTSEYEGEESRGRQYSPSTDDSANPDQKIAWICKWRRMFRREKREESVEEQSLAPSETIGNSREAGSVTMLEKLIAKKVMAEDISAQEAAEAAVVAERKRILNERISATEE